MMNPPKHTTPDNINFLASNEIFVYGANEAGVHGAGAAKVAIKWGAKMGSFGFNGQTYGIPTKDRNIKTLPLDKIKVYVDEFLLFAIEHPDYIFLVTPVGCGLAGYSLKEIAPLFKRAVDASNIDLPLGFFKYL